MNININFGKLWPFGKRDQVLFTKAHGTYDGFLATHFQRSGTGGRLVYIPMDQGGIEFSIKGPSDGEAQPEVIARINGEEIALDAFGDNRDADRAMRMIMCAMRRSNPSWKRYWWPLLVGISAFMLLPPMAQIMMAKAKEIENGGQPQQVAYMQQPQQPQALAATSPQPVALKPGSISLDGAIHYGKKNGKTLYVFSDPQCPYCREQEKELASLEKDYSIYVFPTPFKDGSPDIAKAVLCASNPGESWRDAMKGNGATAGSGNCSKAKFAESNLDAFRMLGLSATPTLISADGLINAGYMTANEIRAWAK